MEEKLMNLINCFTSISLKTCRLKNRRVQVVTTELDSAIVESVAAPDSVRS